MLQFEKKFTVSREFLQALSRTTHYTRRMPSQGTDIYTTVGRDAFQWVYVTPDKKVGLTSYQCKTFTTSHTQTHNIHNIKKVEYGTAVDTSLAY